MPLALEIGLGLHLRLAQDSSAVVTPVPKRVAGLVGWWEADVGVYNDAGVTPAANGDTVYQWNDQSGLGNHMVQATLAQRPVYQTGIQNALPGIQNPDGATYRCMDASAALPSGAYAYVAAFKVGASFNANGRVANGYGAAQTNDFNNVSSVLPIFVPSTGAIQAYANSVNHMSGTTAVINTAYIVSSKGNGTTHTFNINGAADVNGAMASTPNIVKVRCLSNTAASENHIGHLLELIVYNAQISAADALSLYNYLHTKWNI